MHKLRQFVVFFGDDGGRGAGGLLCCCLCGLAFCGQLFVILHNGGDRSEAAGGGLLCVVYLQAAEQVRFRGVEMRRGGCFLAFGFSGFPLGLAGAGGVLPQVAFNQMRFALLDALAFFLPVIEGVQLCRCKDDFNVCDGGGLFVAVFVGGDCVCSHCGDLLRGVVRGGDGVQGGGVQLRGFVHDDLIVGHAFHGSFSFVRCG